MKDLAGWCGWCGGQLPAPAHVGRPRLYCSASHRARAHQWRTALRECGKLSEDCRRLHGGVLHRWRR